MKYSFKDIMNDSLYQSARVVFIAGQYNIFNNIVVDKLKELCEPDTLINLTPDELAEFGVAVNQTNSEYKVSNIIDMDTFMDVINIPSMNGKWFCKVDLKALNKKKLNFFERYIKDPSPNGILVVVSYEYKDFKKYLKNKALLLSKYSHIIQLSFPYRQTLNKLVIDLFDRHDMKIDSRVAQLFIMKLGNAYDEYNTIIDNIALRYRGMAISYNQMRESLRGFENYLLEDFIKELVKPLKSAKIVPNRHVYKMLNALLVEFGAENLVLKLRYKIDELIEFRILINKGLIPIKIHYSTIEVKNRLGEEHPLAKLNDFRFRLTADIASSTSLRDWVYMKLILSNISGYNKSSYERALYSLIHRSVLPKGILNRDIGINDNNILESEVYA